MDAATITAAGLAYLAACLVVAVVAMRRAQPLDQWGDPTVRPKLTRRQRRHMRRRLNAPDRPILRIDPERLIPIEREASDG